MEIEVEGSSAQYLIVHLQFSSPTVMYILIAVDNNCNETNISFHNLCVTICLCVCVCNLYLVVCFFDKCVHHLLVPHGKSCLFYFQINKSFR